MIDGEPDEPEVIARWSGSGTFGSDKPVGVLTGLGNLSKALVYPVVFGIDRLLFPKTRRMGNALTRRMLCRRKSASGGPQ